MKKRTLTHRPASWVLAANMQHSHTHPHRHLTLADPPTYQYGPSACQIPLAGPEASPHSLVSPAWSLPENAHAHPMHTQFGEIQTLAPSSWHQPLARLTLVPPVASFWGHTPPFLPQWLEDKTPTGSSS